MKNGHPYSGKTIPPAKYRKHDQCAGKLGNQCDLKDKTCHFYDPADLMG